MIYNLDSLNKIVVQFLLKLVLLKDESLNFKILLNNKPQVQ